MTMDVDDRSDLRLPYHLVVNLLSGFLGALVTVATAADVRAAIRWLVDSELVWRQLAQLEQFQRTARADLPDLPAKGESDDFGPN